MAEDMDGREEKCMQNDNYEDLNLDGMITLKLFLNIGLEVVD